MTRLFKNIFLVPFRDPGLHEVIGVRGVQWRRRHRIDTRSGVVEIVVLNQTPIQRLDGPVVLPPHAFGRGRDNIGLE